MKQSDINRWSGEFGDTTREATFRAERLPETVRYVRVFFLCSVVLNTLFLVSDWRFHGEPHFWIAVPSRLAVIAGAILAWFAMARVVSDRQAQMIMLGWQIVTATGVGFLVTSASDLALFVVMLLPSIFYLCLPLPFRLSVAMGAICSGLMLIGYLGGRPDHSTWLGMVLGLGVLNTALALVINQSNRLRRLEWAATQSERQAKNELATSEAMIERLFMTIPIPLVVATASDGRIVRSNMAAADYVSDRTASAEPRTVIDLFVDPAHRLDVMDRLHWTGRVDAFETEIRDADGSIRDILLYASWVATEQEPLIVSCCLDISERKAIERQTRHQASHDALTGLANRALFADRLAAAFAGHAQPIQSNAALFLIDLDDFKSVNDTLGHDAGDALLVETARRLTALAGPDDMLARLGGDEFAVLAARPMAIAEARAKAERWLDQLRLPLAHGERTIASRASIGFALAPHHGQSAANLMKSADLALYRAKETGGNLAVVYDASLRAAMVERVTICNDIRRALEAGQIVPFYQPQVSLRDGRVVGFEALARWIDPARGVISAGAFAQAFEAPDLAAEIGRVIIDAVIADMREWQEAGHECGFVSVNFSTGMFSNPNLAADLLAKLHQNGIAARRFGIELTETVLLARVAADVERTLTELRAAGVRIALDDFGTGYASLTHLKRYPVDVIKIDRSFVRDLETDPEDAIIVQAVLDLGRNLAAGVVAEGVENEGQERFLIRHGCQLVQGFRYAKPVAASRVPWLLAQRTLIPAPTATPVRDRSAPAA